METPMSEMYPNKGNLEVNQQSIPFTQQQQNEKQPP